jgi:hypothetical protein
LNQLIAIPPAKPTRRASHHIETASGTSRAIAAMQYGHFRTFD